MLTGVFHVEQPEVVRPPAGAWQGNSGRIASLPPAVPGARRDLANKRAADVSADERACHVSRESGAHDGSHDERAHDGSRNKRMEERFGE